MKITIEFDTENVAFETDFHGQVMRMLNQAAMKIELQMEAVSATACTTDESMHKLLDIYGNTVGTVRIKTSE